MAIGNAREREEKRSDETEASGPVFGNKKRKAKNKGEKAMKKEARGGEHTSNWSVPGTARLERSQSPKTRLAV